MASQRRAGILYLKLNGQMLDAKGNFTYNPGVAKREAIIGADVIHGFKETPQVPFIEGEITDRGNLDVAALVSITGATVTIDLANGKVVSLTEAWFAGDGNIQTEEANIAVRFEGTDCEEVPAS